jgi:hypothetical protein
MQPLKGGVKGGDMHQGSCLCGAVKYKITADINTMTHCHCAMCRKAHGAAFGSYCSFPKDGLRFTQGADAIARFESSPGIFRTFCRHCGSTLQWLDEARHPEQTSIAVGTLDTPLAPVPQKHIFTNSKANWYVINDGLPQS